MSSKIVCLISFSGIVPERCARTDLMFLESHTDAVVQKPEHLSPSSHPRSLHGQEVSPEVNQQRLTFIPAIVLQDCVCD